MQGATAIGEPLVAVTPFFRTLLEAAPALEENL
jgi:hypothetical protein